MIRAADLDRLKKFRIMVDRLRGMGKLYIMNASDRLQGTERTGCQPATAWSVLPHAISNGTKAA